VIFGKQFAGLGLIHQCRLHLPVEMRRAGLVVERVEDGDGPELRIRKAAARTRIVSGGWIWPGRRELSCYFKYMARGRIPEVVSSAVMTDTASVGEQNLA
jgi:hypothetical protein